MKNQRLLKTVQIILAFSLCCMLPTPALAETPTYVLGQIGDQTLAEGELLNFNLKAPEGFGPDVEWSVEGLPEGAVFSEVPAFPGAEGFGAATQGGRGGKVIKVTNLNRTGPGSLHEALLVDEPRIIVFDVSGVIDCPLPNGEWLLNKSHRLYVADAPVTIAGQTAPGAGITIKGQLNFTDRGEDSDNVVARFLRLRAPFHQASEGDNLRAGSNRAIFDHISGAWGCDENFDLSNLKHATLQWCGIEEAAGYGAPWDPFIDRDADGMLDHWEEKAVDLNNSDDIKDFVTDFKPNDDPDQDGLTNLQEYQQGSNPLKAGSTYSTEWDFYYDSDNDGMADWWEQKAIAASDNLSSLADVSPNDDLDRDLSTNIEEYYSGTTPIKSPNHNYGMIMGYKGKNISLHHNFFAHHKIRTPLTGVEVLDHRNNIIYNCGLGITWHPLTGNQQRPGEMFKTNIVGNYFKVGPNSSKRESDNQYYYPFIEGGRSLIYSQNNFFDFLGEPKGLLNIFEPERKFVFEGDSSQLSMSMHSAPFIKTHTAQEAYDIVLAHAGCLPRDAVTKRNVEEIKTRKGKWGKETPKNGLLEGLNPTEAPQDSDSDGMPDQWELDHGLNPNDGSDAMSLVQYGQSSLSYNGQKVPGTENRYQGYTFIEYYINEKADQLILKELYTQGFNETSLPGFNNSNNPILNWVPSYDQTGEKQITLHATDGSQDMTETINVTISNTNRSPFIYHIMKSKDGSSIDQVAGETIEPGEQLSVEFYVKEPDQGEYSVNVINGPDGGTLNPTQKSRSDLKGGGSYDVFNYTWSPTNEDVGWMDTITFKATDKLGKSFSRSFNLKVTELQGNLLTIEASTNAGGSITPQGSVDVKEGENISFILRAENDYTVSDLIIDGESTGKKASHTFENVSNDHTIKAEFAYSPGSLGGEILKMNFNGNMQDSSGFNNHGQVLDPDFAPTLTMDRHGKAQSAYEFDGKNDFIEIPDNAAFSSNEYSITAWIYGNRDFSDGGSSQQYIISKGWSTNSIDMYVSWDQIYTSGEGYPHSDSNTLNGLEKNWIHLAVTKGNGLAKFYVNGEPQGVFETSLCEANTSNIKIGARDAHPDVATFYFEGKIDDIHVFNKILSEDDITEIYRTTNQITNNPKAPKNLRLVN